MTFVRAGIPVVREKAFEELRAAIDRAVVGQTEKFLKRVRSAGLRVRNFDGVLDKGVLDEGRERRARQVYGELTVSDQAQIRELYLFRVEEIGPELRHKFLKLYQYY